MAATISIYRKADIERITGLSLSTIDRLEASGQFPERVQLTPNTVGWHSGEVNDWITSSPRASDVASMSTPIAGVARSHVECVGGSSQVEQMRQKRLAALDERIKKAHEKNQGGK